MNQISVTPQRQQNILIAGIGNIFLGDDGFGVEVAQRLLRRKASSYPAGVRIIDFGIRGVELAYTLLDGYDLLILVDALPYSKEPGALHLLELDLPQQDQQQGASCVLLDAHSMDPVKLLAFAQRLGAIPGRALLVGCEATAPANAECDLDFQPGLSEPVLAAVAQAIQMIDAIVSEYVQ